MTPWMSCYLGTEPGSLPWWVGVLCLRLFCENFCHLFLLCLEYIVMHFHNFNLQIASSTVLSNSVVSHWLKNKFGLFGSLLDASWRYKNNLTSYPIFKMWFLFAIQLSTTDLLTCVAAFVIIMLFPPPNYIPFHMVCLLSSSSLHTRTDKKTNTTLWFVDIWSQYCTFAFILYQEGYWKKKNVWVKTPSAIHNTQHSDSLPLQLVTNR